MDNTVIDRKDFFALKQIENRAERESEESFKDYIGHIALQDWIDAGNGRVDHEER